MGALVFSGERRAIWAHRTALDVPLVVPRAARGGLPGLIISHRALDRKEAAVMVGDDQEERFGRAGVGHGGILPDPACFVYMIKDIIIYSRSNPAKVLRYIIPSGKFTESFRLESHKRYLTAYTHFSAAVQ